MCVKVDLRRRFSLEHLGSEPHLLRLNWPSSVAKSKRNTPFYPPAVLLVWLMGFLGVHRTRSDGKSCRESREDLLAVLPFGRERRIS
jgi:hypothetical protein